jgi:putative sterol carrier protein
VLLSGAVRKRLPLHFKETDRPDFEIIAKEEFWWQIAEGSLAPLRAFCESKMGLRGDIQLGERLLMQLAAQKGRSEKEQ